MLLVALLVAGVTAAVDWPVLGAQAHSFDDSQFVTYNPLVTHPSWKSVGRFFGEVLDPSTVKGYYLPLSMTSLMLDWAMGGRPNDYRVFHRTSLALHAACAACMVLILYALFGSLLPAALGALLFSLHPLTVEPLAWVGERKTLLAALFGFASIAAYLQFVRRRSGRWQIASLALFVLALLSKPTVVALPLLLLVLDAWPLARLSWRTTVEKWPWFALALLAAIVTWMSHARTAGITADSNLLERPLHVSYLLAFYLLQLARPTRLSCAYSPPSPFALSNPVVLASVVTVALVTVAAILLARRTRAPLAGWLFFVVAIAPTLGLVQYSWVIASDKYVYFPVLGLVMLACAGWVAAWNARAIGNGVGRVVLVVVALAVLAAEARGARATLAHWSDSFTLAQHMLRVSPNSPPVLNQIGVLLGERGDADGAFRYLRQAVAVWPEYPDSRYNLGLLLADRGQNDEALVHLAKAAQMNAGDPEVACLFGISLSRAGRLPEAEAQMRRAVQLKPDYLDARNQLGGVLVRMGRTAEAAQEFRSALAISSQQPFLHFRLAMALLLEGGHDAEAITHLRSAIDQNPGWPEPWNALAWLFSTSPDPQVRNPEEALLLAARAVELTNRRDPKVLDTLAAAQAAAGQYALAAGTAQEALALIPDGRDAVFAAQVRDRLQRYRRGVAYVEAPGANSSPMLRP